MIESVLSNRIILLVTLLGIAGSGIGYSFGQTSFDPGAAAIEPLIKDEVAQPTGVTPGEGTQKPYLGLITADRVYVRSGPAGIYYPVCYLQKDQQVIVREVLMGKNNWAKIEPTAQCFSYIAKEFVTLTDVVRPAVVKAPPVTPAGEPADVPRPGATVAPAAPVAPALPAPAVSPATLVGKEVVMGEVTGNAVRVRAGSMGVEPALATQVQLRLNKGDKVRVIGERDAFYKIVSPSNAYFWVSLDFIKQTVDATPEQFDQVRQLAQRDVAMMIEPEKFQTQYDEYLEISKLYEQEQKKALLARDYQVIIAKLDKMLEETRSTSIQRSAEGLKSSVERVMTAQETMKRSQERDHMLMMKMQEIDRALQAEVGAETPRENKDMNVTVRGVLAHSAVFTAPNRNRRFLVINDQEKIECYAVTNSDLLELEDWVNRRVVMVGDIKYDSFSKSRILFVNRVEAMTGIPAAPATPADPVKAIPEG